ncbi:MAG: RecX family transcriptional regulator [Caldilineaceae bacterium]
MDAVVEAETDPNTAALEVARRQAHRWLHLGEAEFQKKLAGLLQRRGFRWETIRETIQQVWQEQEIENNDEESFD